MIGQKLKEGALRTAVTLTERVKRVQVRQEGGRPIGELGRSETHKQVLGREPAEDGRGERLEVLGNAKLGRAPTLT